MNIFLLETTKATSGGGEVEHVDCKHTEVIDRGTLICFRLTVLAENFNSLVKNTGKKRNMQFVSFLPGEMIINIIFLF